MLLPYAKPIKKFGVFIKILGLTLKGIVPFFIIYGLSTLAFTHSWFLINRSVIDYSDHSLPFCDEDNTNYYDTGCIKSFQEK